MIRSGMVLVLCVSTLSAQPAIPDTPVGKTFKTWLDTLGLRSMAGGFELRRIVKSDPWHIEAILKEHASERKAFASMDVSDGNPAVVTSSMLRGLPPGANLSSIDMKIDAATRGRVLDSAAADLTAFYVWTDVAKKMIDAMRAHQKRGDYDTVSNGARFADLLTRHLRAVSHDFHLSVNFSPVPMPPPPPDAANAIRSSFRHRMERSNCAFEKVEVLPGNVGYVKFNNFGPPDVCGPTASAAMAFLGNVDAIIFDLRDNGGGDPDMVAYLATYLFDQPTHLNDLWTRKDSSTRQFWTLAHVPGKRLANKPAYVLTSKRTFSGGEEFTYDLKNVKRAVIVGETTGGGAHPVAGHRIDDRFMIGVPFATAINPVTKTSWEGTGVTPDVSVSADSALARAVKLAADTLALTARSTSAAE